MDAVRVLLSRGSYRHDETDCCGTTPLMDALRAGCVDIAKLLIQQQHVCSLYYCCMKMTHFLAQLAELFIQAGQNTVCVCLNVNQGETNRTGNHYTQRLVILHARTY